MDPTDADLVSILNQSLISCPQACAQLFGGRQVKAVYAAFCRKRVAQSKAARIGTFTC